MTSYCINREKLKELLLAHKSFIADKCRTLQEHGHDMSKITYRETKKWTDEFIDTMIDCLPISKILDEKENILKNVFGMTPEEYSKKCKERNET